ncbi:MAG: hypothetical protein U1D67_05750, partial [Dehalococcoidia bacterium]|nr:hypothetical protein [Dehalococcoidia bacterium]
MIALLARVPETITIAAISAAEVADRQTMGGRIGFVVLAIIVGPVIILTVASMLGHPRTFRIPALFLGSLVIFVSSILLSFAAVSLLLGFVV